MPVGASEEDSPEGNNEQTCICQEVWEEIGHNNSLRPDELIYNANIHHLTEYNLMLLRDLFRK